MRLLSSWFSLCDPLISSVMKCLPSIPVICCFHSFTYCTVYTSIFVVLTFLRTSLPIERMWLSSLLLMTNVLVSFIFRNKFYFFCIWSHFKIYLQILFWISNSMMSSAKTRVSMYINCNAYIQLDINSSSIHEILCQFSTNFLPLKLSAFSTFASLFLYTLLYCKWMVLDVWFV